MKSREAVEATLEAKREEVEQDLREEKADKATI